MPTHLEAHLAAAVRGRESPGELRLLALQWVTEAESHCEAEVEAQ